ncbi:BREX-3 system phosphatase PglZ [Pseudomonas thivervalensis]|uniref:BREX-3 system phosphatase PglZ n=1 Tax=Pseudomonas thivervalensis TaxID=86265 RepID=UPI003CF57498
MNPWIERVLKEFPEDVARLWVAADPDDVLLDEQVLLELRERGFDLLPFEDSVMFRTEFESRYREAWDRGEQGPAKALILHLANSDSSELPWDYLSQAKAVRLTLAELFPRLSYNVVRHLAIENLQTLFAAQGKFAKQTLGESATRDFLLTHIYKISPHLLSGLEDLWVKLLNLHYGEIELPEDLALHMAHILTQEPEFRHLPLTELFSSRSYFLRVLQDAWCCYLRDLGVTDMRGVEAPVQRERAISVPFDRPQIRAVIDSLFLDGSLHPLEISGGVSGVPEWALIGLVKDPFAMRNLIVDGAKNLEEGLPALDASYRDWGQFARRFGELLARFHGLEIEHAKDIRYRIEALQGLIDQRLLVWVKQHFADLPSLPAVKGPVMVHHVPHYLARRRNSGETRVALLVFDGLAVDQWVHIREHLAKRAPHLAYDESTSFAWLPTLTSVSRQALFSGLRPREFEGSIDHTSKEPSLWSTFWQGENLRANEVLYRKSIKRVDDLPELAEKLSNSMIKVAGLVIDTVDEIVHGAVLGKRGIASQITNWCETGFVEQLLEILLSHGYHIYLTADHGNVEAVGAGRLNEGDLPDMRGERARAYRNGTLRDQALATCPTAVELKIPGLPESFLPIFAAERTAFVSQGEQLVVHGGISVEELIVPFVKIFHAS